MKRNVCVVLTVCLLLCPFAGCAKETVLPNESAEATNISSLTVSAPEPTTLPQQYGERRVYTKEEIKALDTFEGTYDQLITQYPNRYEMRTILFGRTIVYYGEDKVAVFRFKTVTEVQGWTLPLAPPKREFELLKAGDHIHKVFELSPSDSGSYPFGYAGRVDFPKISYHYTSDGYLIELRYDEVRENEENELYISEILVQKVW